MVFNPAPNSRTFCAIRCPKPDARWENLFSIHCAILSPLRLMSTAAAAAVLISRSGDKIEQWIEKRFSHLASGFGHRMAQKVREFGAGLNTIHGPFSLLSLTALSLIIWYVT